MQYTVTLVNIGANTVTYGVTIRSRYSEKTFYFFYVDGLEYGSSRLYSVEECECGKFSFIDARFDGRIGLFELADHINTKFNSYSMNRPVDRTEFKVAAYRG